MAQTYDEAVSAWARHLRSGGTTTWRTWTAQPPTAEARGVLAPLPDAVHLELVRRINLAAVDAGDTGRLADLVLATPAHGRGRVEVPLPWPERPAYGDPPIDPDDVPDQELLRVAVGALARLLPGVPPPPAPHDLARWPLPWRRRFRLHGSPGTVAAVRTTLLARGFVESDWNPVHLVVGRPLDLMMAEQRASANATGGQVAWTRLWRRAMTLDAVPGRLDVVGTAERLAAAGVGTVHLVLGREGAEVATAVATILRTAPFDLPGPPDPGMSDLLQQVNRLTALRHGRRHVRRLATTLEHTMAGGGASATPPGAPVAARAWARRTTRAWAARTASAGYSVHGEPGVLAPTEPAQPASRDRRHTLDLAVEACLRTWNLQEGSP